MVVDDSRVIHAEIKRLLADSDYEIVGCCRSGEDSIALFEECQPDLVTMDIVMPGMDGFDTVRTLQEKHPDVRVLMLSSLAYDDTIDEAVEIGAKGFVFKPIDREQLISALDDATKDMD